MSPRTPGPTRRSVRILIPAIGVPVAVALAVIVPMQANAAVDLPDKTVEQLLQFARSSDVSALSGTIEQRSELGLPDLSGLTAPEAMWPEVTRRDPGPPAAARGSCG